MLIMQEEIFGPLLPIRAYNDARQVVAHINKHDRPLGLYYFGEDKAEQEYVLTHTTSGGVTVNDVFMHFTQEDLPFGGVGPSGMGVYHGHDGFKTFSHAKSVFKQSKWDLSAMLGLKPPFGPRTDRTIAMQIKR
jgi:coniferyl-aldehyde dehydrogenase